MEESVALDSTKQKQFVKSVRGIKKLLKKTSKKPKLTKEPKLKEEKKPLKKPVIKANEKKNKIEKKPKKRVKRGLVYLSHIPHGFYEHQMTEYFKQFGAVTNARVIRSKRTGMSKGYAFVEFKEPSVAEIVADTMNNYLMGKRLIKAVYIPPEKQKLYAKRKNWNFQNNPASEHRLKMKKTINADKNNQEELKMAKKLLSNLSKTKGKLRALGVDYDFFVPVDIPEGLKESVEKTNDVEQVKGADAKTNVKPEKKLKVEKAPKSEKKMKTEPTEVKNNSIEIKKENKKKNNQNNNKTDTKSKEIIENKPSKQNKKLVKNENQVQEANKKKVTNNKKAEKPAIKKLEDFIQVNKEDSSDESDGSVDFDSDEFEKMMENDEDNLSSADESDETDEEVAEKLDVVKEKKKPTIVAKEKNVTKTISNKQAKRKNEPEKRKNSLNAPATTKKAKFEKQNKKTLNKVIKKRK